VIRVTRRENDVLCIDTDSGTQWIPKGFVSAPGARLEMRILYDLADYLEKQATAAILFLLNHYLATPEQYPDCALAELKALHEQPTSHGAGEN
jgi:hypothetical protein